VDKSAEQAARTLAESWGETESGELMRQLAADGAPRLFAIVEECEEGYDARVAGYGLAYENRAEVDAVEGGFHLSPESAESARALFEVSSRSAGPQRVHLVWLDQAIEVARQG
jgi:hypothetical protein